MSEKVVSIVIPIYNEHANISLLYEEILRVCRPLESKYRFEVLAVDDGSEDGSIALLQEWRQKDARFQYIQFSRNFGKEIALSAGIDMASGDAVIMMDADLQHPVELLPEFLKRWEQGAEVVVGVREKNSGEGWTKRIGSWWFYKIMNVIGETKITPRATDYRLLDKQVVREFRKFTEHGRITRGLIDWLGFKREYIHFEAKKRESGRAGYSKIKLVRLAFSAFIAHSLLPLKLAGYLGLVITSVFGIIGLLLIIGKYGFHNAYAMSFSGPAQLAILIIFLVGLVLSCLGLVALYIATIKDEVANRPNYVVRKRSFDPEL